jgi:hypothetical protein
MTLFSPSTTLCFEVFNLIFKSEDLSSKPVSGNHRVFDCLSQHVDFELTCDSSNLFLV